MIHFSQPLIYKYKSEENRSNGKITLKNPSSLKNSVPIVYYLLYVESLLLYDYLRFLWLTLRLLPFLILPRCVLVTPVPSHQQKRQLVRWLPTHLRALFAVVVSVTAELVFGPFNEEPSCLSFHEYVFVVVLFQTQVVVIVNLVAGVFFHRLINWFWGSSGTGHHFAVIGWFVYLCHDFVIIFLVVYFSVFCASLESWRHIVFLFSICSWCVDLFAKWWLILCW